MRPPTPEERKRFFWMMHGNDEWYTVNRDTDLVEFKEGTPKEVLESYALWEAWRFPDEQKS